jgi:hypothetical protein
MNQALQEPHQTALVLTMRWEALLGQQDLLREEIKRGTERLAQVRTALAERRLRLEEWPTYEQRCSAGCLPSLTEVVWADERLEQFLTAWLERRQKRLEAVDRAINCLTDRRAEHIDRSGVEP